MLRVDDVVYDANTNICKNIEILGPINTGLLSQNILSQIRNLVEYIIIKIYSVDTNNPDINPNAQDVNKNAIKYVKSLGAYRDISKFHDILQKSVSHYTIDEDGSERLMLKYYENLLNLRVFMKQKYNMTDSFAA